MRSFVCMRITKNGRIKEYLENDGTSNPILSVTEEGKAVYLSGKEILFVEADKTRG